MSDKKLLIKLAADVEALKNGLRHAGREVSIFEKGVISAGNSIKTYFGAYSVYRGLEYGVKTLAQFERQMDTVQAITGATGAELKQLQDNALNLAGSFRSIDIARMETELGRLGLSTKEIINSTEAIVALATATGEDLAKSADTVGSTLRIYNLEATKAGQVTDIMAQGFNMSALALDNFTEAIKYVGPVANSAGLSLQQTTALLGVLADNGIRGSMAGTSLRKIISDLGQGAGPVLAQRLREMAEAGLSGADAMDEVGRTAYAALLILANNTDKINNLTKGLNDSAGAAKQTAKIMEDNLLGDWQKFVASMDQAILKGTGVVTVLRSIVQTMTDLTKITSNTVSEQDKFYYVLKKAQDAIKATGEADAKHFDIINSFASSAGKQVFFVWDEAHKKIKAVYELIKEEGKMGPMPAGKQAGLFDVSTLAPIKEKEQTDQKADRSGAIPHTVFEIQEYEAALIKALAAQDQFAVGNLSLSQTFQQATNATIQHLEKLGDDAAWENIRSNMQTTGDVAADSTSRMVYGFMMLGNAVGNAANDSIRSGQSFVVALLKQTDQVVAAQYAQAVAGWIKAAILDPTTNPFPWAKFAMATAGVAVLKGLYSGISNSQSAHAAGMSVQQYKLERRQQQIQVTGELRGRGSDLVGTIDNYNRGRSRRGT